MRNCEERVAAVRQRTLQIKQKQLRRRADLITAASAAACLLLLAGLAFIMPAVTENFPADSTLYSGMTAGIFHENGSLGYVVVSLIAFILGICLTIFCYNLHSSEASKTDGEQHHD